MNYPDSSTVNTTAKKISFSPATRALIVGLALLLPGAAALAGEPIPGIDVKLGKNPGGGSIINAPTGADGAYKFTGLAAGNYELSVGGKLVQTITVGDKGSISGMLSREPNGTASITFNGQDGVVPDEFPGAPVSTSRSNKPRNPRPSKVAGVEPLPDELPGAPVSTTRSNKKHAIAKAGVEPLPDVLPGAPINTSRSNKKHAIAKAGVEPLPDELPGAPVSTTRSNKLNKPIVGKDRLEAVRAEQPLPDVLTSEANSALGQVSTTRGTAPRPDGGDVKPGISDQGAAGGLSYATAPPPKSGEGKSPGLAGEPIKGGAPPPIVLPGTLAIAKGEELPGIASPGTPFSFGSGNTPGVGPGMSAGPGMVPGMSPGAGPMGGPMSPGPSPMGGPGGPGAGMRR